ncbi:MAG: ABC transporter permease [Eubacterium sp.]|nr:ABC transporter permease [Eubacterium sp.]
MFETLKKHQFLLEELIKRDFKKKYKGALLGMAWSVLNPLLSLVIMRIVFTHFFNDIPHYTTYLFCGTIVYTFFSEATSEGMLSLVGNAHIFTKVNVPKNLFIISKNTQTLVNFAMTLVVFFIFCLFDGITFSFRFFLLLYPIVMLLFFNLGLGLILSAFYVFFRDMRYLWSVLTQLLMYMSAMFYSIESFSYQIRNLFLLNPIYLFIRYFRKVVIDEGIPSPEFHLLMAFDVVVVLGIGAFIYKKYDTEFLYYV